MEVKKCPNCGAEIPEDREYCEQCEEQLKQTVGTSKREEMNQNSDLAETVVSQKIYNGSWLYRWYYFNLCIGVFDGNSDNYSQSKLS